MVSLLNEGGHAIYVAPSGGRDRIDPQTKNIEVARFDPQSIDLFLLMAKKSTKKTHFYSLALSTHHLLPPPETTEIEIGEQRTTKGGAIHLAFGKNIDTHHSPFIDQIRRKREMRQKRASYIWEQVRRDYSSLPK